MELQVFVSKKGTRVVIASHLYKGLDLAKDQFPKQVKKWLNDIYEFSDGIRKPERMRDFAKRAVPESIVDDYYLSVEFAKLIALASHSKHKIKYARWLSAMEDSDSRGQFDKQHFEALLELAKSMGKISCQIAGEQQHYEVYLQRNGGSGASWWRFRRELLGYSADSLRERAQRRGIPVKGKSQRQLLWEMDPYELIRTGVIDFFMAMGKTANYARMMGDIVKTLAKEIKVELVDDREAGTLPLFQEINPDVIREIKTKHAGNWIAYLQHARKEVPPITQTHHRA